MIMLICLYLKSFYIETDHRWFLQKWQVLITAVILYNRAGCMCSIFMFYLYALFGWHVVGFSHMINLWTYGAPSGISNIMYTTGGSSQGAGIGLGMRPANERRRYIVTTSLIGWTHTETDPWGGCVLMLMWPTFAVWLGQYTDSRFCAQPMRDVITM